MATELAIKGGPRIVPDGMVKGWPPITQQDRDALLAVLDSGHLHGTSAPQALALQKEWAEYCGAKHCLVTNSGTSAIHMALAAARVEPGDEVIVPAFTYWSTAAAVLHQNAIPIFVDIDPRTFTMAPDLVEAAITDRTRALLPVDIHGMPCDYDPIMEIARRRGLVVIADACQSHGASYKGKRTGSIAHATAFSTNRSKNLSSGEGGLYTTDNDEYYEVASRMREFGEVVLPDQTREYNAFSLGWMYRSLEWTNAFCRSQLTRLEQYNAARREFAEYLTEQLAGIPGFDGPYTPPGVVPAYFSYIVRFRPEQAGLDAPMDRFKRAMIAALRAEGVNLGQWQTRPVPGQDVFQKRVGYGKGCPWTCRWGREATYRGEDYPRTIEFIANHSYLAGVYPPNTMELMKLYIEGFKKVADNAKKVLDAAS
ncbi:MAG TPA: DegT/DnrJ/EryC1/StrS family aminotransferase [Candidatus Brocadiia bacterium]|nr:DegT/DnrJ/EryC1/StrS family aminotransferase [Candidatus Brocadiia bacterium]